MLKIKRILPVLAILALAACTDAVGPTDPLATASAEGVEQNDPAGQEREQARGGDRLAK